MFVCRAYAFHLIFLRLLLKFFYSTFGNIFLTFEGFGTNTGFLEPWLDGALVWFDDPWLGFQSE